MTRQEARVTVDASNTVDPTAATAERVRRVTADARDILAFE
jgi:hypothetical protein